MDFPKTIADKLSALLPEKFTIYGYDNQFSVFDSVTNLQMPCSESDFANIDKRLPVAMRTIIKDVGFINNVHLSELVSLWGCWLHLRASTDDMVAFSEVSYLHRHKNCLVINGKGFIYRTFYSSELDTDIFLPETICNGVTVDYAWLNENYPEWQARFDLADDLELTRDECMRAILMRPANTNDVLLPSDLGRE